MAVSSPHHGIDEVSVVGQKDQSFGIFVQASSIGQSLRAADHVHDLFLRMWIPLRADDAYRLVESEDFAGLFPLQNLLPHLYGIRLFHLLSHSRDLTVDQDFSLFDEFVRISPGAYTALCQIFIQPHPASSLRHPPPRNR